MRSEDRLLDLIADDHEQLPLTTNVKLSTNTFIRSTDADIVPNRREEAKPTLTRKQREDLILQELLLQNFQEEQTDTKSKLKKLFTHYVQLGGDKLTVD